jgi:hypothetical protein
MSLAFVACVERGPLEAQALLLCASIRRYGGNLASAPIHVFRPRRGLPLTRRTHRRLRELDVALHEQRLNTDYAHFPRTNKIFVCEWAEQNLDVDHVVFVDSDTVFLQEPSALLLDSGCDVAIRPVDTKTVTSCGEGDPKDGYWLALYAACGVVPPPFIETSVDRVRIRACFNSGLVSARRRAGVFAQWREDFETIMKAGLLPPVKTKPKIGMPFLDQNALATTLSRFSGSLEILPDGYNYCLPKRDQMPEPLRSACWKDLVHLHYHKAFSEVEALSNLSPPLDPADQRHTRLDSCLPHGSKPARTPFAVPPTQVGAPAP